jgi:hypothetical protein
MLEARFRPGPVQQRHRDTITDRAGRIHPKKSLYLSFYILDLSRSHTEDCLLKLNVDSYHFKEG